MKTRSKFNVIPANQGFYKAEVIEEQSAEGKYVVSDILLVPIIAWAIVVECDSNDDFPIGTSLPVTPQHGVEKDNFYILYPNGSMEEWGGVEAWFDSLDSYKTAQIGKPNLLG